MHDVIVQGVSIPCLAFGTWDLRGDTAREMVSHALQIGYRHIDTAVMYGNETEVGQGIHDANIARDAFFLTTKIWPTDFEPTALRKAAENSLQRLGVDHVNLLLLHWPNKDVPLADTLHALAKIKQDGLAQHIGVSNFNKKLIEESQALCQEPLVVNQIEYHPFLNQDIQHKVLSSHDMALAAYCPIARGRVFKDPVLVDIAKAHQKNPGQVALRWLVQQTNVIALPRTSNKDHAQTNLDIFDFELDDTQTQAINALTTANDRIVSDVNAFTPVWDTA